MNSFTIFSLIINTGKYSEALKAVLNNAPLGCLNQQVKVCMKNIKLTYMIDFFNTISFKMYFLSISTKVQFQDRNMLRKLKIDKEKNNGISCYSTNTAALFF